MQMENVIFNLNTNCKLINSSVKEMMNSIGVPKLKRLKSYMEFLFKLIMHNPKTKN